MRTCYPTLFFIPIKLLGYKLIGIRYAFQYTLKEESHHTCESYVLRERRSLFEQKIFEDYEIYAHNRVMPRWRNW